MRGPPSAAALAARAFVLALIALCGLAPAVAAQGPGTAPAGVDPADYGRAFAYWGVGGLDPALCPSGPIAVYDEPLIEATNVPVADASGAVRWVAPIAFVLSPGHPCEWWFGDAYLALDAVHRCHVVTHEIGHLLGHPAGPADASDPLGVMVRFALTPQCAELVAPPESISQPDPMAVAMLEQRAREVAELTALGRRWDRYDRRVAARAREVRRRARCLRAAANARTARSRSRARARCRARVAVPARPTRPRRPRP